MNHHWARKLLKDFETNPATQIRFHFAAMVFWMVNLLAGGPAALKEERLHPPLHPLRRVAASDRPRLRVGEPRGGR